MEIFSERLSKIIATGLGLGYAPKAPGTVGSLGALLISLIVIQLFDDPFPNFIHIILALGAYFKGYFSIKKLTPIWGQDPSKIVIDEFCGLWFAMIFIPPQWEYYISAFILFRVFDISKILGIKYFDNLKTTHGVLLDDVIAGLYTGIILYSYYWFVN